MIRMNIGEVQCVCGWVGRLPKRSDCPGCGRDFMCRVTPERLEVLIAMAARQPGDPPVPIVPMMRRWLTDPKHRLIEADGPPPSPSVRRRARRPVRAMRLTKLGELAVHVAKNGSRCTIAEDLRDGTVLA